MGWRRGTRASGVTAVRMAACRAVVSPMGTLPTGDGHPTARGTCSRDGQHFVNLHMLFGIHLSIKQLHDYISLSQITIAS